MLYKTLSISAKEALNATTSANTIALLNGANILRVHDVKEAVEAAGITAKSETLAEDRAKFRDALATITAIDGLIGPVTRDTATGEASKPYVFVQVVDGKWKVIHDPRG